MCPVFTGDIRSNVQVCECGVAVEGTNWDTGHGVQHVRWEHIQLKCLDEKILEASVQRGTTRTRTRARSANVAVETPVFTENTMRRCTMCAILRNQNSSSDVLPSLGVTPQDRVCLPCEFSSGARADK